MAKKVDFTQFSENGPPSARPDDPRKSRWWKLEGEQSASAITSDLEILKSAQTARMRQLTLSARLYGNVAMLPMFGANSSKLDAVRPVDPERVSYNIVQSAVDTAAAKIAKNKPKPMWLTSGGNYRLRRKAKKRTQFCEGLFFENDAHRLGVRVFIDAAVFGDGLIHVFVNKRGRLAYERVVPSEVWVDEVEGRDGCPRTMHRVRDVDRDVLLDEFADDDRLEIADAIMRAASSDAEPGRQTVSDLVSVRESWHLPSGPDAEDGLRVVSIDGFVLEVEQWKHDFFPFVRLQWCPRLWGYWSQGLAEQLQPVQLEIIKICWTIKQSLHLAGTFKVWLHDTSRIVEEHINNNIGTIIKGTVPPQYLLPPAVQPEVYQYKADLKRDGYEQAGVSQLSAAAKKPDGLDSGKALREFNDIESDRFMLVGQAWERLFMDLGRMSIAMVKDLSEGGYKVLSPTGKSMVAIEAKDIGLDEPDDVFFMQVFPVSSLPSEPAGRSQTVQEWVQAGWVTPRQGKRLMNFPDLEQAEGLGNASEEYLTAILERIVDDGEFTPPDPMDDLQLARELALQFYAQGKSEGLEPERLEMLRVFLRQLDELQAPPQPPMPAMEAPTPQAPPVPPQPSDLVPNAPQPAA